MDHPLFEAKIPTRDGMSYISEKLIYWLFLVSDIGCSKNIGYRSEIILTHQLLTTNLLMLGNGNLKEPQKRTCLNHMEQKVDLRYLHHTLLDSTSKPLH